MELTQEQKLYAEVVQKAWENAEFKKMLIANPLETIEELTGKKVKLPVGKTLVVIDESETRNSKPADDKTYLVIPENKQADFELTERELESVAGGLSVVIHFDTWDLDLTLGGSSDQKK